MPESGQESISPELQENTPKYHIEEVAFAGSSGQVMRLTGDEGSKYEFGRGRGRALRNTDDVALDPVGARWNDYFRILP